MKLRFTPLLASLLAQACILLWGPLLSAQEQNHGIDRLEIFGGYSFAASEFGIYGGMTNGWNAALNAKFVVTVVTRMVEAYNPKVAGVVTLSEFRNCTDRRPQITLEALTSWKTDKGIGLGSDVEDVRKAYGKPSDVETIEGTMYRSVIHGNFKNGHYSNAGRQNWATRY